MKSQWSKIYLFNKAKLLWCYKNWILSVSLHWILLHSLKNLQWRAERSPKSLFPRILWQLRIWREVLEFAVRLWNSEWSFGIQSEAFEFGVSFWNSEWGFEIWSEYTLRNTSAPGATMHTNGTYLTFQHINTNLFLLCCTTLK